MKHRQKSRKKNWNDKLSICFVVAVVVVVVVVVIYLKEKNYLKFFEHKPCNLQHIDLCALTIILLTS